MGAARSVAVTLTGAVLSLMQARDRVVFRVLGSASARPLLWLSMSMVTSCRGVWSDCLWRQLISPGIALALFIAVFLMPAADRNTVFAEADLSPGIRPIARPLG